MAVELVGNKGGEGNKEVGPFDGYLYAYTSLAGSGRGIGREIFALREVCEVVACLSSLWRWWWWWCVARACHQGSLAGSDASGVFQGLWCSCVEYGVDDVSTGFFLGMDSAWGCGRGGRDLSVVRLAVLASRLRGTS